MEGVLSEFEEVDTHWTRQEDETIGVLEELLRALESESGKVASGLWVGVSLSNVDDL